MIGCLVLLLFAYASSVAVQLFDVIAAIYLVCLLYVVGVFSCLTMYSMSSK